MSRLSFRRCRSLECFTTRFGVTVQHIEDALQGMLLSWTRHPLRGSNRLGGPVQIPSQQGAHPRSARGSSGWKGASPPESAQGAQGDRADPIRASPTARRFRGPPGDPPRAADWREARPHRPPLTGGRMPGMPRGRPMHRSGGGETPRARRTCPHCPPGCGPPWAPARASCRSATDDAGFPDPGAGRSSRTAMRPDGSGDGPAASGRRPVQPARARASGNRSPGPLHTPTDDVGDSRFDAIEKDLPGIWIVDVDGIPSVSRTSSDAHNA